MGQTHATVVLFMFHHGLLPYIIIWVYFYPKQTREIKYITKTAFLVFSLVPEIAHQFMNMAYDLIQAVELRIFLHRAQSDQPKYLIVSDSA